MIVITDHRKEKVPLLSTQVITWSCQPLPSAGERREIMGSDGDATEESLFPQNLNLELAGVKRLEEGGKGRELSLPSVAAKISPREK